MSNFLIKLTPVDKFFFGGDMAFYVEGDESHNDNYGTYFVESSMFPQQTSLLGMLRFLLLRGDPSLFDGSRIIPGKEDEVVKLIGASSFQVRNQGRDTSVFGKIRNIHRCFVLCTGADGSEHPLDFLGFDHEFGGRTLSESRRNILRRQAAVRTDAVRRCSLSPGKM